VEDAPLSSKYEGGVHRCPLNSEKLGYYNTMLISCICIHVSHTHTYVTHTYMCVTHTHTYVTHTYMCVTHAYVYVTHRQGEC